jgi:hypothetical protein
MFKVQRAFLMVVGLVVMGAVPFARAQAASTVLGATVCLRAAGQLGNVEYNSAGLKNTSGTSMLVVCTLFRDNTVNTNGMQDLEVAINDPVGGTECKAISSDRQGNQKKVVTKTNGATGNVVIDFGSSLNVSVAKGYYTVQCQIPDQAIIRTIFYVEP